MVPATESVHRLRETNTLAMDPDRTPGFCFLVHPPNRDPYEVFSIHYLPATPDRLTGTFEGSPPSQASQGIRTPTKSVDGIHPFCFDFHQGDPLGEYRVDVFVNNQLEETLRLEVVPVEPPGATDYSGTWKANCSDGFGLIVAPASGGHTIAFFGPGGALKPGPPVDLRNHPRIEIRSQDHFIMTGPGAAHTDYHRCE